MQISSNKQSNQVIIARFFRELVKYRNAYDAYHGPQTSYMAGELGAAINLPLEEISLLKIAAELHDLGKFAIPESLINKPSRLTIAELSTIHLHAKYGYRIARAVKLGPLIEDVILHHHENQDGSGYPDGLIGDKISIHARIIHITDAFDALTSERPYRGPHSPREAIAIIQNEEHKFDQHLLLLLRRKVTNWTSTLSR